MSRLPSLRRRAAALTVVGALGALTATALALTAASRPRGFAVSSPEATRTVAPGRSATYVLRVRRTRRMRAPVRLALRGLPRGARGQWRRGTRRVRPVLSGRRTSVLLRISTPATMPIGSRQLTVLARSGRRRARLVLTLRVRVPAGPPISIGGDLTLPLAPGRRVPLDLTLLNPSRRIVWLRRLTVRVDERTSRPECSGSQNFRTVPIRRLPLPLVPGPNRLSRLLPPAAWPQVEMLDLPVPQDGCRATRLTLHYSAQVAG